MTVKRTVAPRSWVRQTTLVLQLGLTLKSSSWLVLATGGTGDIDS